MSTDRTEEPLITIGFTYKNEFGEWFRASSEREVFHDLGEDELSIIGEQLNTFLKQVGYIRRGDYILMEDLTEDEYNEVSDFLYDLRHKNNNDETDEESNI